MEEIRESMTAEDFNTTYAPMLQKISDLMISHPEIPEDLSQSDLLTTLQLVGSEVKMSVENKVPEITSRDKEIDKLKRQNIQLQQLNQQLNLKVTRYIDQSIQPEPEKPKVKKSPAEIARMIDSMKWG